MKNIKQKILLLNIIIKSNFFYGCSQSATAVFKKEPIYAQNLQYTKIGKLIVKDEVKALVNITYLNSVDSLKWNNGNQNFLVGIYIPNKVNENYNLQLNDNNCTNSNIVQKSDNLYKNIAFKNHWADYYIFNFNDIEGKTIKLVYSDDKGNSIAITFVKE